MAEQRFDETVNIQQQNLSTGAVGGLLSLADRLEGFKSQQIAIAGQEAIRRGRESAAQIDLERDTVDGRQVTKAPEKKKDFFIGGIEVRAHNKALQGAYVASLNNDNRESIAAIKQEHSGDLIAFNEAIDGYRRGVLKSVDPSVRQLVAQDIDNKATTGRINIQANVVKQQQVTAKAEMQGNIDSAGNESARLARNGDTVAAGEELQQLFATNEQMVESGLKASDVAATENREAQREVEEQFIRKGFDDLLDEKGLDAAFGQLSSISKKVPKGWTPDEWDAFIGSEQRDLNQELSKQEKVNKEALKLQKKEIDFSAVSARIAGDDTQIVNPKVINSYYDERVAPLVDQMPLEQKQANQAIFIDRMKMIPASIEAEITNAARSDNPELAKEAALLIDRIDETVGVVEQIPASDAAYITNVTALMNSMAPQEAVMLARRATDPKDKARIEAVDTEIKAIKNKPELYKEKAEDAFDTGISGFFGFSPDIDDVSGFQMAKEYGVLYENFRRAGMSDGDAFDKADKTIKRNWGVTNALGTERIMKYPPEQYYALDGEASWMQKELLKDVQSDIAGLDINIEDIVLMGNDETARTATTGQPTYAVKVLIDGSFQTIGQWRPDLGAELDRRKKLNVDQALNERKKLMQKSLAVEQLRGGFGRKQESEQDIIERGGAVIREGNI